MWAGIILAGIVVLGFFAYAPFYSGKTIYNLLGENKHLKTTISNLN